MQHEGRMKQPKGRTCGENRHEKPAANTFTQPQLFAGSGALDSNPKSLQNEIRGRKAVAPASGHRDHQVMDHPREQENQKCRGPYAEASLERMKDQVIGEPTKAQVPSLSPEFGEGNGAERRKHDGLSVHTEPLPDQGNQMKTAEMQKQDQSDHPQPTLP